MPVLRGLARAIKDTDVPFDKIVDLTSGTATGKRVTASSSLRVATVYAAVRLLAESIGSLPTKLVRREGNRRIVQDGPLADLLTVAPNPEQDAPEFYRTIMGWMLLEGDAYEYVERDSSGMPKARWPVPSPQVTVGRTPSRRRYFEITLTESDPDIGTPRVVRVGPESMLHYKAFGTGTYGLSPIQQVREAIGTALAAQEYMGRFYQQDASPGGVVKVPGRLDDAQFDRLKRDWQATHQGVNRSHLLAVLEGGAEWQKVGLNPGDAAFIETQKWEAVEIARAFGVPPHMIGDVERSTSWGTGIAEQGIAFVTYTLMPWITRLEWVVRRGLLADIDPELRLKWQVDALQRGDTKARYEAYQIGRNWGFLSANDIRAKEDEEPIDGGDVYLQPLNMVPADTATVDDEDEPGPEPPRGGERQALDVPADATMVALYPPADVADQLAVTDGLTPDDLHVTLAYLGRDLTADQRDTADRIVASVAAQHRPLEGIVGGGLGQFPAGDDGTPVWAPVDVPGLAELRHRLVEQLDAAGVAVASDHGFTPHMTLTYLTDAEDPPAVPDPQPATFETLSVATGGIRQDHPLTGRRQRHDRGLRSSATRKRLASRFAPLIADADREVAEREREEVSELVRVHLEDRSRSPAAFAEAIRRLYDGSITDRMMSRWLPILTTLAAEVAHDAAEDVGDDDPPDLERWVRAYVVSHVGYQTSRSVAKIVGLSSDPEPAEVIRNQLDRWVEERPAVTGRWESTQMSRAAAREAWKAAGVREMVWVASSACELCADLDGQVVGIEQPFLASGTQVQGGEKQSTLEVHRDTFHPPLHPGCDCDIAPR